MVIYNGSMKDISFNFKVFNNHLSDLKNTNERDYFNKKLKAVYSWLEWLKERSSISITDYREYYNQVKEIEIRKFTPTKSSSEKIEDTSTYSYLTSLINYKTITLILLVLLSSLNLYLYKLYSSLSDQIEVKQSSGRVLPFKGKIKETDGDPLDTKRDIIFTLYSQAQGGRSLYSGKCLGEQGLQPEFNGAFTILIGSDCGMKPIPEDIFQNNSTLYLGMAIGSEKELEPRYQIFTTTYSKDTSKLQGLELGKNFSSIPYIDETGRIQLDVESPVIKSTNGELSIQGERLSFKAEDATKGNIIIQPGSESNVIIPFGKLGLGNFEPNSILDISGTQLFTSTASIKNFAIPDDESTSALRLSLGTELSGVKSNFIEFFAGASSENPGKKIGDIRINNEGVVYETAGADFAEYFTLSSTQEIISGTIVSLSPKGIRPSLPNEKIIGAASLTAGFIGNRKDAKTNSVLVALVGQVDVLVSTINGEMQVGDRIGATTIPGYGGLVRLDEFSIGYLLKKNPDGNFTNESCPKSYKNKRDRSGKKIRCGTVKIILDLD